MIREKQKGLKMNTERDAVKSKIAKLMALGTSSNLSEATIALEKASKLMAEWGLTTDDIELGDDKIVINKIDTGRQHRPEIRFILVRLAKFCSVKIWNEPAKRYFKDSTHKIAVLGYEQDVQLFEHFWNMLNVVAVAGYKEFKENDTTGIHGKSLRASYMMGFCDSVNGTLAELNEANENITTKSGTALVPLKMANIDDFFEKEYNIKLVKSRSNARVTTANGYSDGYKNGSNVRFNTPVNGGRGTLAIAC